MGVKAVIVSTVLNYRGDIYQKETMVFFCLGHESWESFVLNFYWRNDFATMFVDLIRIDSKLTVYCFKK